MNMFDSVFIIFVIVGMVVLDILEVIEWVLFEFEMVIILNILIILVMVFIRFNSGYSVINVWMMGMLLFNWMVSVEIILEWICLVCYEEWFLCVF